MYIVVLPTLVRGCLWSAEALLPVVGIKPPAGFNPAGGLMDQPSSIVDRRRQHATGSSCRDVACYVFTMRAIGRWRTGDTLPAFYYL